MNNNELTIPHSEEPKDSTPPAAATIGSGKTPPPVATGVTPVAVHRMVSGTPGSGSVVQAALVRGHFG